MENSVLLGIDGEKSHQEEFYSPLSLKGYLTPLQRQKLREKRGLQFAHIEQEAEKPKELSKLRKRKKERYTNVPSKSKMPNKITKPKEKIPHVRYLTAKVVPKTISSVKDKKFFKSSPSNRLERASFSISLDFKRNLISKLDKCVKEQLALSKQKSNADEHYYDSIEPSDSLKADEKENSEDASFAIKASPDEEKSLFEFDWPSDEILLKRQEAARSNLKKLHVLKESTPKVQSIENEEQTADKPVKLYPVFYPSAKKKPKDSPNDKRKAKTISRVCGHWNKDSKGGEQLIIDAGQKEIGAKICSTCKMIYSVGHGEDEKLHTEYHNMYLTNLKFPGWKDEKVIGEYQDGRVIIIRKDDHLSKIKKIEDILAVANRDLGFSCAAVPTKPDVTFILFISNSKEVAGCIIAESISCANRVVIGKESSSVTVKKDNSWRIGCWYSGPEKVPAVCGINRIWVAHKFRRHKIASRMIDCLRCHFIHGHVIGIRELAFTDPSPDGREFAAAYTKTDNFLVYR